MADFRGYVTAAGQTFEALAKQMGYPVTIGFIEVGDGKLPDSESPIARTQLVHKLKQFPAIVEQDAKNPGQWVATCYIPADDAINGAGYFIREIGCKLINQGNGVLYAYRRVSDDWKPVVTSGEAKSFIYKLRFIPSNGELLTPTIDPSVVLVDKEELARVMKEHVESRNHPDASETEKGFSRHATENEITENESNGENPVVTVDKLWAWSDNALGKVPAISSAWKRLADESGYELIGTFGDEHLIDSPDKVLLSKDGTGFYAWDGDFPKNVSKDENPSDSLSWLKKSTQTLREILSGTGGAEHIGTEDGLLSERFFVFKKVSPIEKRFAGGADPTGEKDSTDALEACINYCSPFLWKGSVSETKKQMGSVIASMSGFGKFRITRPLKVNPFLVISSDHVGGFFGQNGGFQIIADFDDKNGFAIDAAPYNKDGVRVLSRMGSRADWDNGLYTGCPGFSMFGVDVVVKQGRVIRGILNRCLMQQSHIHRCSMIGASIGTQNSVSWGGSMRDNHIVARAIPILNGNDMTVDDQQNNYLSVAGLKPTKEEFDYPHYPSPDVNGKTCCVFNSYGHPIHKNNIWEGAEIGAMCVNAASMHLDDNYVERISDFILAAHTVSVKLSLSWAIAPSAKLIHARAASVELVVNHSAYISVSQAAIADADSYSSIHLKGLKSRGHGWYFLKMPYHPLVNYEDAITDGVRSIFVSAEGDDANTGYHVDKPVRTLQEALSRVHNVATNRIYVRGRIDTKYSYRNGENVSNTKISARNVEIIGNGDTPSISVGQSYDEVHAIPPRIESISVEGVDIDLPAAAGSRMIFIPGDGRKNIRLDTSLIRGSGKVALIGPVYGRSCIAMLECRNSTLSCALQEHYGNGSGWAWMDVAVNTSTDGGNVGSATGKKISSSLYP